MRAAQAVVGVLRNFMDESRLSMGGGMVLQWDWKHRCSTDVDLFYPPDLFAEACRLHREAIERASAEPLIDPRFDWSEDDLTEQVVQALGAGLSADADAGAGLGA